jgi:hypothetical protein
MNSRYEFNGKFNTEFCMRGIYHSGVTLSTNRWAPSRFMTVSYVVGRSRGSDECFVLMYRAYSASNDNILMWVCKV